MKNETKTDNENENRIAGANSGKMMTARGLRIGSFKRIGVCRMGPSLREAPLSDSENASVAFTVAAAGQSDKKVQVRHR
jgi:hypothetical protein